MVTTDSQSDKDTAVTELEVEKIISNGCGLARYSGRAVFIPFTVPGERILAEIDLSGKSFLEGKVLEIIRPSSDRVDPVCPLYGKCGGCSLQHISYKKQLEIKKDLVSEAFRRNGKITFPVDDIVSGEPYGYRCRIQLHPSAEEKGLSGFRERKGSRVVPVENCPVCNEGINRFLSSGGREIKERTTVFSPESSSFYLSSEKSCIVNVNLNNLNIETDPSSFFQSNIPLFEEAVKEITQYSAGNILLDLYAGAAVFGTAMADRFKEIISVEENKKALKCGERNIPDISGLKKQFYPETVEKYIKRQYSPAKGKKGKHGIKNNKPGYEKRPGIMPDTVIVDPPRTGLSPQVRSYLKILEPEVLIYLSCDYTTMARDLGDLASECYNIDKVKIFDFYPQTAHAETLAVLSRKK